MRWAVGALLFLVLLCLAATTLQAQTSTLSNQLFGGYLVEGMPLPYTKNDFIRTNRLPEVERMPR